MFTDIQLKEKTIYFLRCPRTGSTCIMPMLQLKLKDKIKKFIPTHDFSVLEKINSDDDTFLIRTDRKDKTELFISSFISKRLLNIKNANIFKKEDYANLPVLTPTIITTRDVELFLKEQEKIKYYWSTYAINYDSEVIYYEDALNIWRSNYLPVTVSLSNKEDEPYLTTFKLPYNKKELILNYDEINDMITREL